MVHYTDVTMQRINEEETEVTEVTAPQKLGRAHGEEGIYGLVGSQDVDILDERESLDFDWALGWGTAPYMCGNMVIQLIDIIFHVISYQVDPLHITANCIIIIWGTNFIYNYIEYSRWRTVGFSVILIYTALMCSFFATNGFVNERGLVRTFGITFFVTTLLASVVSQLSLRKIRPSDPAEYRDAIIL